MNIEDPIEKPPSTALLVRSRVKKYALDVATRKRPHNKFSRVSSSFYIAVEAQFGARLRAIQFEAVTGEDDMVGMVSLYAVRQAKARLNCAAQAIIHGMVMKHPSVGVTLKA